MKRILAAILAVLFSATFALAQQTSDSAPATKEDVQQLMSLLQSRRQIDVLMDGIRKQNRMMLQTLIEKTSPAPSKEEQAKILDHSDELFRKMLATMPWDDMMNAAMPAYEHHFTHADIQAIIRFYSSPVGQKFITNMPALTAETMQAMTPIMQKWIEEQMPMLQKDSETYAQMVLKEKAVPAKHD